MPTGTLISVAYLATSYRPDCDYVETAHRGAYLGFNLITEVCRRRSPSILALDRNNWESPWLSSSVQVSPTRSAFPTFARSSKSSPNRSSAHLLSCARNPLLQSDPHEAGERTHRRLPGDGCELRLGTRPVRAASVRRNSSAITTKSAISALKILCSNSHSPKSSVSARRRRVRGHTGAPPPIVFSHVTQLV